MIYNSAHTHKLHNTQVKHKIQSNESYLRKAQNRSTQQIQVLPCISHSNNHMQFNSHTVHIHIHMLANQVIVGADILWQDVQHTTRDCWSCEEWQEVAKLIQERGTV